MRRLLILLALTLAVLAWYFVVERPREERRRTDWHALHTLPSIDPALVTGIEVARESDTLAFALQETHWVITAPIEDVADQGAVNRILQSLSGAQVERDLGAADDLAQYGLDPPAAVITVSGDDGRMTRVSLGAYTVDHSQVYGLLEGRDGLLLLPTGMRRYALYPLEDYRNKRIANFDISVVTRFTVTSERESMTWFRHRGEWLTVSAGDTVRGDNTTVEAILRRIRGLRAWGFADPREVDELFRASRRRVDIVRAPPHPSIVLRVAGGDSGRAFTRVDGEDRVVQADTSVAAIFRASLSDLRDRRILHFDPVSAARVEITTPDTTATLIRAGARWAWPNPALAPPDERAAASLMRHLVTMRFTHIVRDRPERWEENLTFRVVVSDSDGTLIDEVAGRRATAGATLVTGPRLGLVAEVSKRDIDQLTVIIRGMNSPEP